MRGLDAKNLVEYHVGRFDIKKFTFDIYINQTY